MQSDWNAEIAEQAFKHYLLVAHTRRQMAKK